jgi:hypothetical protein
VGALSAIANYAVTGMEWLLARNRSRTDHPFKTWILQGTYRNRDVLLLVMQQRKNLVFTQLLAPFEEIQFDHETKPCDLASE